MLQVFHHKLEQDDEIVQLKEDISDEQEQFLLKKGEEKLIKGKKF